MPELTPPQLRSDLLRLARRGLGVRDFSLGAARLIARAVPFDGVCVLTMDPATLLPTGEIVENGPPPRAVARMVEIEMDGRDVNNFAALAGAKLPAAVLSLATDGDLDRSQRHREVRGPHGYGDELRAVLVDQETTWGALTLLRAADQRNFTPADTTLVASVTRYLGEGLRRAMLLGALPAGSGGDDQSVGLVVLAADNTITMADAAADRWLAELGSHGAGHPLPAVLSAVARRARSSADPATTAPTTPTTPTAARSRVRCSSGQWLLVRGSTLGAEPDAPTAVIIEPARSHDMAPLLAAAHGLTGRERTVAQLVARGHGTAAIADRLHLSAWTVQDHLKSIFGKVGVGTRAELIARLFFEHYAPRLADHARTEPGS